MNGSIVFARRRQCVPPSNTCFLGPIRVHTPQAPRSVQPFRTAHGRRSSQWATHFPLKIALVHRDLDAHLIYASLGPLHSASPTPSQSVQPFLHRSWQRFSILHNGSPLSPSKLSLRMGGSGPPSNRGFLGPTTQMASRSVQPFLTDRHTDQVLAL